MLAHWVNRDRWISGIGPNFELEEIWDGGRFNELSWFWNRNVEWMLPWRCQCCGTVMGEKEIRASPEKDGIYTLQCEECGTKVDFEAKFV